MYLDPNSKLKAFTISEINSYLKELLESDLLLDDLWLVGEISNLKFYSIGEQVYFYLSDGQAQINCVIYNSFLKNINFELENGLKVLARGKIKVWPKKGTYTFQIFFLKNLGSGLINLEFEKLKTKLQLEGLFAPERKKVIPKYPEQVGLITALNSAAMIDFVTICAQKAPNIRIVVIPATMQGSNAPKSLLGALEIALRYNSLETIIILRGGGSSEDLGCFNDESLVRKIANYPLPIISAIGHEIDYTLVDFAADLRLATPTAAAEYLVRPYLEIKNKLNQALKFISENISQKITEAKENLENLNPLLKRNILQKLKQNQEKNLYLINRLEAVNPLRKLAQGYSICTLFETQEVVKSVKQIKANQIITTQVYDGKFQAKILDLK